MGTIWWLCLFEVEGQTSVREGRESDAKGAKEDFDRFSWFFFAPFASFAYGCSFKTKKPAEAGFMIGAQEGTRTPTMLLAST
jgi:hypothetical protein